MGQLASGAFDGSGTGVFPGGASERKVICSYDFAVQGGAVSSIVIGTLPAGSSVIGGHMVVETAILGGATTCGIDSEAASDLVTAAVIGGAPWSTTGRKAINPKRNTPETSAVVTTIARNVVFAITGAAVTAGKFKLHLYVENAV